ISSLIDKVGNKKNKFSKAILIGGVLVFIVYFLDILTWSMGSNFVEVHSQVDQHLGNLMYGLMDVLSKELASSLHFSSGATYFINQLFIRFTALTLFVSYIGLLATIGYAPLKVLIQGGDSSLFPKFLLKENKNGILVNAVHTQALIIAVFVVLLSLGSALVSSLYNQLTLMTNLSRSLPYLLIALSYPFFKAKFKGEYMQLIKHKWQIYFLTSSVFLCVFLAVSFEVYSTFINDGFTSALFLIIGPLLAGTAANIIYKRNQKRKLQVQ
ncbi:MAG: amino acid permease, partial [Erysipelotrichales bacterium]